MYQKGGIESQQSRFAWKLRGANISTFPNKPLFKWRLNGEENRNKQTHTYTEKEREREEEQSRKNNKICPKQRNAGEMERE